MSVLFKKVGSFRTRSETQAFRPPNVVLTKVTEELLPGSQIQVPLALPQNNKKGTHMKL